MRHARLRVSGKKSTVNCRFWRDEAESARKRRPDESVGEICRSHARIARSKHGRWSKSGGVSEPRYSRFLTAAHVGGDEGCDVVRSRARGKDPANAQLI